MPKEAVATGMVEKVLPLAGMWQGILERCRLE
jgi:chemotaxis response regulator CheB